AITVGRTLHGLAHPEAVRDHRRIAFPDDPGDPFRRGLCFAPAVLSFLFAVRRPAFLDHDGNHHRGRSGFSFPVFRDRSADHAAEGRDGAVVLPDLRNLLLRPFAGEYLRGKTTSNRSALRQWVGRPLRRTTITDWDPGTPAAGRSRRAADPERKRTQG